MITIQKVSDVGCINYYALFFFSVRPPLFTASQTFDDDLLLTYILSCINTRTLFERDF